MRWDCKLKTDHYIYILVVQPGSTPSRFDVDKRPPSNLPGYLQFAWHLLLWACYSVDSCCGSTGPAVENVSRANKGAYGGRLHCADEQVVRKNSGTDFEQANLDW